MINEAALLLENKQLKAKIAEFMLRRNAIVAELWAENDQLRKALHQIKNKDSIIMPCDNSPNCYVERGPFGQIAHAALQPKEPK